MEKKYQELWELCSLCNQVKLIRSSNHECPPIILIKRELEMDEEVEEELIMFDFEKEIFWDDPQIKFLEYLAAHGEI